MIFFSPYKFAVKIYIFATLNLYFCYLYFNCILNMKVQDFKNILASFENNEEIDLIFQRTFFSTLL